MKEVCREKTAPRWMKTPDPHCCSVKPVSTSEGGVAAMRETVVKDITKLQMTGNRSQTALQGSHRVIRIQSEESSGYNTVTRYARPTEISTFETKVRKQLYVPAQRHLIQASLGGLCCHKLNMLLP